MSAARRLRRQSRPADFGGECTLCHRTIRGHRYLGVWAPTKEYSDKLGAPPGKHRRVAYVLCERCFRRPDQPAAIEDALIASFAAALASPEAN